MAVGKEEFFSLEVLHFTRLYLRSESRSVNRPCRGCVGSLRMEAVLLWTVVVDALQRGQWSTGVLLSSLHHSLQSLAVHGSSAAVPHGDATGQVALYSTGVEVAEDL